MITTLEETNVVRFTQLYFDHQVDAITSIQVIPSTFDHWYKKIWRWSNLAGHTKWSKLATLLTLHRLLKTS